LAPLIEAQTIDGKELLDALVVGHSHPTLGRPRRLNRVPNRSIDADLPSPIIAKERTDFGDAGLLQEVDCNSAVLVFAVLREHLGINVRERIDFPRRML